MRADRHDSIDVAGNLAPDGIVGPHREKEASYYTIKELWSPGVQSKRKQCRKILTGRIAVENRYLYTNLNQAANLNGSWLSFPKLQTKQYQ